MLLHYYIVVSITDEKQGIVKDICGCKEDTGRSEVEVLWSKDKSKSSHRILDLKYVAGGAFFYYYDHLPALGKGTHLNMLSNDAISLIKN